MSIQISNLVTGKYGDRFTAVMGGVTIKNCQHKSGTSKAGKEYEFISLPQRKFTAKDGTDKWEADIVLSRELSYKLLEAYKEYVDSVPEDPADTAVSSFTDDDIPF